MVSHEAKKLQGISDEEPAYILEPSILAQTQRLVELGARADVS